MHKFLHGDTHDALLRHTWLEAQHLVNSGVAPERLLLLAPTREHSAVLMRHVPDVLRDRVQPQTFAAFVFEAIHERWTLVASQETGLHESRPPVYLPFELAQYLMHQVVQPLLELGYFEGLTLRTSRIVTALLHTLNHATVHELPLDAIPQRLQTAWGEEDANPQLAQQILTCLTTFRERCARHNVIDFSLTQSLFAKVLLPSAVFRNSLTARYEAVIGYLVGEYSPLAHRFFSVLLDYLGHAVLLNQAESGVRFLQGADPTGATALSEQCDAVLSLPASDKTLTQTLAPHLRAALRSKSPTPPDTPTPGFLGLREARNVPRMLHAVVDSVRTFRAQGIPLSDLVLVAPHIPPVTRFVLEEQLGKHAITPRFYLRQERLHTAPDIRALLTVTKLAYPQWDEKPLPPDVALMLQALVPAIDPVRASLLSDIAFDIATKRLEPTSTFRAKDQERLGPVVLDAYQSIVTWLENMQATPLAFEDFLVEAQAVFPTLPTTSLERLKRLVAQLRSAAPALQLPASEIGLAVLRMIEYGYAATDALLSIDDLHAQHDTLLITTVQGYLLTGLTKRYHLWLDVGDAAWWASPIDPIAHPPALSKRWTDTTSWDANAAYTLRITLAYRQLYHLLDHCSEGIVAFSSEAEDFGETSASPLLRAFRRGFVGE